MSTVIYDLIIEYLSLKEQRFWYSHYLHKLHAYYNNLILSNSIFIDCILNNSIESFKYLFKKCRKYLLKPDDHMDTLKFAIKHGQLTFADFMIENDHWTKKQFIILHGKLISHFIYNFELVKWFAKYNSINIYYIDHCINNIAETWTFEQLNWFCTDIGKNITCKQKELLYQLLVYHNRLDVLQCFYKNFHYNDPYKLEFSRCVLNHSKYKREAIYKWMLHEFGSGKV